MTDKARGELVPGGLAMVKGFSKSPKNLGKIVTTQAYASDGDCFYGVTYSGDGAWLCIANGLWACIDGEIVKTGMAFIRAEHLTPIHPESDPLDIAETMEQRA